MYNVPKYASQICIYISQLLHVYYTLLELWRDGTLLPIKFYLYLDNHTGDDASVLINMCIKQEHLTINNMN